MTAPSTWLPPETPRQMPGIRCWVLDRAVAHRSREESSATSDGANEAADRADECETIARKMTEWGGVE